jgi:hypothetical protein
MVHGFYVGLNTMLRTTGPEMELEQYGRGAAESGAAVYYRFATAVHKSPETEEVKISSRVLFSKDHFTPAILSQIQFVIDSELVSESPDPQERLAHFSPDFTFLLPT